MDSNSDSYACQNNENDEELKKNKINETNMYEQSQPVASKKPSTKSKVRPMKILNDYDDVIDSELTTVLGQLTANPNLTTQQARVAAKREYNRLNAARARGRQKDRFRVLKREYSQMKSFVQQLQSQNEILQSQVAALLQLRNQQSASASASLIASPQTQVAHTNIFAQSDKSTLTEKKQNDNVCVPSMDDLASKLASGGKDEVFQQLPTSIQHGMTGSAGNLNTDTNFNVSSSDLVNAAISTVMSMMVQQQNILQQTGLNQSSSTCHQNVPQRQQQPIHTSTSPQDRFLSSHIHALCQPYQGQLPTNYNPNQHPLPTFTPIFDQFQDQQRDQTQTESLSKVHNHLSSKEQTDMSSIIGMMLQNFTASIQSAGIGTPQSGGTAQPPSDPHTTTKKNS
jgi:hypothetical protein